MTKTSSLHAFRCAALILLAMWAVPDSVFPLARAAGSVSVPSVAAADQEGGASDPAQQVDANGVHVSVSFTGEVAEWRLKGPDGKYYTTGLLKAGSYTLGVRFQEGAQWAAFPVPLGEGLEVKVDCTVESETCRVRSRPRS